MSCQDLLILFGGAESSNVSKRKLYTGRKQCHHKASHARFTQLAWVRSCGLLNDTSSGEAARRRGGEAAMLHHETDGNVVGIVEYL